MKKQIAVLILMLLLSACLTGCDVQNTGSEESADTDYVKAGKYLGSPYTIYSSFMPILSIEDNNTFVLELGINKSIRGTYKIDNSKLELTSDDGNESYAFEIKEYGIVIEREIPGYVKENTVFKFVEQKNQYISSVVD